MSQLVVEHLVKRFESASSGTVDVLRDVSFTLASGDSLAIVGPSGTGKSTLLHLLGTLDTPTSGSILFDGVNPFQLSETELARFRNAQVGMIFQDHHLLPQLTVMENVLVPALAIGSVTSAHATRASDLIRRVGLQDRVTHFPSQLSGGERQRVAVARALLTKPLVLLADEPTGSLDRQTAEQVGKLLVELQREEQAILVTVTHTPALASMMARQAELADGQLKFS